MVTENLPATFPRPMTLPVFALTTQTDPAGAVTSTFVVAFTLATPFGAPAGGAGAKIRAAPADFTKFSVIVFSLLAASFRTDASSH